MRWKGLNVFTQWYLEGQVRCSIDMLFAEVYELLGDAMD